MVVTMLPVSSIAEVIHTTEKTSGEIIHFEPLAKTEIAVSPGIPAADLELPETLIATVRIAKPAQDSGESASSEQSDTQDSSTVSDNGSTTPATDDSDGQPTGTPSDAQEPSAGGDHGGTIQIQAATGSAINAEIGKQKETGEYADPEWEETTVDIQVTWACADYDMDTNGDYVFTPVIEDYTVSTELPEITVIVGTPAFAAPAAIQAMGAPAPNASYDLWVGETKVTATGAVSGSDITGTVTYDADTKILTLSNATITSAYTNNNNTYGIYSTGPLSIELEGNNTITPADNGSAGESHAVYGGGDLTISGSGTFTASGGSGTNSSGIYATTVSIEESAEVTANGGTVTDNSYGIYATTVSIEENAKVTANGGTVTTTHMGRRSSGIYAITAVSIEGSAVVTATGGTATATGGSSYGTFGDNAVTISGTANVKATSGTSNLGYGIYIFDGTLTIQDGAEVEATGTSSTSSSYGIFSRKGDITINKSTVTAESGTAPTSYGIYANNGNITIRSGEVTAKGVKAAMNKAPDLASVQVMADADITGSNASPVTLASNNIATYKYIKMEPAQGIPEQFNLAPGGTYYFDLSGEKVNIGTVNANLPDTILHYVPFTYAGTVNAYSLDSNSSGSKTASANATASDRSLFVGDYNIGYSINWNNLNTADLIFGKPFDANYELRSLSAGSSNADSKGSPATNEWDQILDKSKSTDNESGWIKNWNSGYSWAQDTSQLDSDFRVARGSLTVSYWGTGRSSLQDWEVGFRPALEVLNPDTLGDEGLKAVTLKLNGGKLKNSTEDIKIICSGGSFKAPSGDGLTPPDDKPFSGWKDTASNTIYAAGSTVPNTVTGLIAQWKAPIIMIPIPTANADLKWTGNEQTGVNAGTGYSLSGTVVATAVDDYNATATLLPGYEWNDGTTAVINISWSIAKADGSPAPTGLSGVAPRSAGGTDGKITGTTAVMEYADNASFAGAHDCTATETTGLSAGTYYVRLKATATREAGAYTTVTVVPDPDLAIVAAAKTATENASYGNMTQAAATNEEAIKAALMSTAQTVIGNSDISVTITQASYTLPIAGTSAIHGGTNGIYTFTVTVAKGSQSETTVQKTITITATPYTGGTGGGGGNSGGTNTPASSSKPTEPVTGSTENKATGDGKGNANVSLTDKNIIDTIADAKAEAVKKGVNAGDITAVIHVTTGGTDVNTVTVNLPKTTQEQVIDNKISSVQLVIDRPDLTIGMNLAAVTEINRQAKADVQLSATRMDNTKLSGDAKAAIGNRPAYELQAIYGSGKSVTDFGKGSVSVEIPYTLQKGEIAGNVYAVYVDAKGKVTYLTDSSYDTRRGTVMFSTSHFSTYGIAYKDSSDFTDIDGHWAKNDILFVANRGLMTGTSVTTFSPNGSMTRGMFVTALGRLADADVSSVTKSSFTDVKANAYYMSYIEWGVKHNILVGIGDGKFDPDGLVTREQMAVIMDRYATSIGFNLPEVYAQSTFADNAKIGTWAAPSVKRIQMAGIIQGKSNNLYGPQGAATRAEVSAVLRRFVEQ
ncbi:hypothetical protein Ami103574_01050 [Aminipila butyrica]|uniref:SLH domain-containing protein n=1 Tax=Aminipila butyrica TaxID=433296 RepID=A0A858BSQ8_9FIRM|nr:S-layer homology domain-containing protein [Aminipila butyrica]QIB67980.1 hypothetical protein Ami103574_01050 [Aminipila butyrica]